MAQTVIIRRSGIAGPGADILSVYRDEAAGYANEAEGYRDQSAASAAAAAATVAALANVYSTIAAGLAAVAVGAYFASDESGTLTIYKKTGVGTYSTYSTVVKSTDLALVYTRQGQCVGSSLRAGLNAVHHRRLQQR